MAINIHVGDSPPPEEVEQIEQKPIAKIQLKIRKTLDGDIMIFDHADIDIVVMPEKMKLIAFAKDVTSEFVYGAENRMFQFLSKKGIIDPATVQGGNIYGSIEGVIRSSDELHPIKILLLNISKFIDEERPYFEFVEDYEEMQADRFVDPDAEESTELGEVPHKKQKGHLRPGGGANGTYWQSYTY